MNNSLYDQFAASFAAKSLSSLVDSFNCRLVAVALILHALLTTEPLSMNSSAVV